MIVNQFYLAGVAILAPKANAPLVVNAYAVQAGEIAGRYWQVIQSSGIVQHNQFPLRLALRYNSIESRATRTHSNDSV